MKQDSYPVWFILCMSVLFFYFLDIDNFAFAAAEHTGTWRKTYDIVMKWLNFGILVFLFIKFAKQPLMNFLRGQKQDLATEIEKIEQERQKAIDDVEQAQKKLYENTVYFDKVKERIIKQGEKKRETIIKEAQKQSILMIELAKRKINSHFHSVKKSVRDDLIDSAMSIAEKRIPQELSDEDRKKFNNQFLKRSLEKS